MAILQSVEKEMITNQPISSLVFCLLLPRACMTFKVMLLHCCSSVKYFMKSRFDFLVTGKVHNNYNTNCWYFL